jgi:hypothetical protein
VIASAGKGNPAFVLLTSGEGGAAALGPCGAASGGAASGGARALLVVQLPLLLVVVRVMMG